MRVAVLGCGTIGRGVVDLLRKGISGVELIRILDKKERFDKEFYELFTDNVNDIIEDSSIDTVIEVMGGKGFSYDCVKAALSCGKNVVTANKELIAYKLEELSKIADEKGVYLLYEASVGGGIPFIKTVAALSEFNQTNGIFGILNGTTNYILTKMSREQVSYGEALTEAQRLGFAEADPSADVEGRDLVRKVAILAMLCYNQAVDVDSIYSYPVSGVSAEYICFAAELGYTLKYACRTTLSGEAIDIAVEPVLVKNCDVAASVNYENNIVRFDMQPNDALTFIGKGAGRFPTAAAIISDVLTIRDNGAKIKFKNVNCRELKMNESKVSAIVKRGEKLWLEEDVKASEIRGGDYDFYAIIL